MPTLRITQAGQNVMATFEDEGLPRQTVTRPFSFSLSTQDAEDIRWYLEDYLVYPLDPEPKIASRIKQRLRDVGSELFRATLAGSEVWANARQRLEETRIEVETDVPNSAAPWELLRDPDTDLALALHVPSFVRGHSQAALRPKPAEQSAEKLRILLVICRPGGADDVPFRSVARHLIRGLGAESRAHFALEVSRPPTFEQLGRRLRLAKADGKPFHVVHFDGHGTSDAVLFENAEMEGNAQKVATAELGKLLRETGVPVLILNACRSAYSEPPQEPRVAADVHEQARAFGSLAQAVMDYGASGVVAWRYSVFVSTAAHFMADLYAALASGLTLGEAATLARKQLHSSARPIEDWTVPAVFEAAPVRLLPKAQAAIEIRLETGGAVEPGLPQSPDVGFIGRDETILKLDRMFDSQPVVLLHAYAGSGKTSTAVEFARWYTQTGGLTGPVLFTSFEHHKKLGQVVDQLGREFERVPEGRGVHWLTLDDAERRSVALQVLHQVPVLWIWDNVEAIAGFPASTRSVWTTEEQGELADFLRAARGTKAKFLLTSRRSEQIWLHDLPGRVELPGMPLEERVQMTAALSEKRGRRINDVEDWRPLLRFTRGNPLTLTVLVGQALRDMLRSKAQIEDFVSKLRAGEAVFEDEESEGRTRSLAASLAYGFESAFSEAERKQLALLHLFQGFVSVVALQAMGNPKAEWCLPEVRGLTRGAGIALLDLAAEVGLLTAVGEGYYTIHPAVPWFFRRPFEQFHADARGTAARAFVEAMGELASYYHGRYEEGDGNAIGALTFEEENLLYAQTLARSNSQMGAVRSIMQGLRALYEHTGRRADWTRMVQNIVPLFVDPATGGPLPGMEDHWSLITGYRVSIATRSRRWGEAERLRRLDVEWNRVRASVALAKPQQTRDVYERHAVHELGTSLHELSDLLRELKSASCVDSYLEALLLSEAVEDTRGTAACAFGLGLAYEQLGQIRDLDLAARWYQRCLELVPKENQMLRARCLGQLGSLAFEQFQAARQANRPQRECNGHLSKAMQSYEEALGMIPPDSVVDLAVSHNELGSIYSCAGRIDIAIEHFRESIRYKERQGDRFAAGKTRHNVALALAQAGRPTHALDWARAALRDYEAAGNADQQVVETLHLLELIESDLRANQSPL